MGRGGNEKNKTKHGDGDSLSFCAQNPMDEKNQNGVYVIGLSIPERKSGDMERGDAGVRARTRGWREPTRHARAHRHHHPSPPFSHIRAPLQKQPQNVMNKHKGRTGGNNS